MGAAVSDFYLIRHGDHDWLKKGIAGRTPGIHLNAPGQQQAQDIATRFAPVNFDVIFSSPLERTMETAEPLARAKGMKIIVAPEVLELDFGAWNGATFDQLRADPRWAAWNQHRSVVRMPGGELMSEVQARVVGFLERLHRENGKGTFAIFSHGDAIRSAICYWLGMPLDLLPRVELEPASITILRLQADGPRVIALNRMA
jgi:broad specificity phosphatase PhoE